MTLINKIYQTSKQFNWFIVVLTLLVFSALIKLGFWQSSRALEKEQRLARINLLTTQQAIPLPQVLAISEQGENINDLPISLEGEFLPKTFLLDNQTFQGRLGYRVLQVLQSKHNYVLVNLGWVLGSIDRTKLPKLDALKGIYKFRGNVRLSEKGIMLADDIYQDSELGIRIQQIDVVKISQFIGQKMLPFVVYLDTNEGIGYKKNWQPIVMPPEKHRAYAFQWFSLAIAWLVLVISAFFYHQKHNNK